MDINTFFKIISKVNVFSDIADNLKDMPTKNIGDFFEYLTKFLFLIHPFYANSVSKIWLYKELDDGLKKFLNIPDSDKGIDIVIKMIDGKYCAVQCKYRTNEDEVISWKELSTFAGQMQISGQFSKGYYVTNTYNINSEIKRAKNIITIYGTFFDNLQIDFFKNIIRMSYNKQLVVTQLIPRPHQIELIENTIEHLNKNNRATAIMACGTGKTLGAYWIDKQMNNILTIITVPSLSLLSQFFSDWIHQSFSDGSDISYLLVGSDVDTENIDDLQNGIFITTNENDIYEHILINLVYKQRKVVIITTYQSADKLQFATTVIKNPDLIIFDEAHKTVGNIDKQFNFLMFDKNIIAKKRLFLTATPKLYNNSNIDIVSMDNKKLYGKEIFNYSTRQAINDGYLCDYQIITMITNDKYISDFIKRNNIINIDNFKTDTHYLICAIMILKCIEENTCTHILTYHNSIKSSKLFSKLLMNMSKYINFDSDISIQSIDGSMSSIKRKTIFNSFCSNKFSILTSSKILNEGINLPIVDAVCFVDRRTSSIDIVQCIGRSLRLHKDKKISNIIVPINCSDINNLDNDNHNDNIYGNMINILKSMADSDDTIKSYFELNDKGNKINNLIIYKKYFKLENDNVKNYANIDMDNWINNLEITIWKKIDGWEYMFKKLVDWVRDNNNNLPEKKKNSNDKTQLQLANWCVIQRQNKYKGILNQYKIDKLSSIDNWYWIVDLDTNWNEKYTNVIEYLNKMHKFPSEHSPDESIRSLGLWCRNQRVLNFKGKLKLDRKIKLEEISGWAWKINLTSDNDWKSIFDKLSKWVKLNNKFPQENSNDNFEKFLFNWCYRQKYKYRDNKLELEKVNKLESLKGWKWINSDLVIIKKSWDDRYNDIINWIKINNRMPNSRSKNKEERSLGQWYNNRRSDKKDNKLTTDQLDKFNSIANLL